MNSDKPIIIEFVGMYGSGKTVTGQALTKSLREQGFKVKSVHDFYEFRDNLPRFSRWFKYITRLSTWSFFFPAFLSFLLGKMKFKTDSYDLKRCFGPAKDVVDRERFLKTVCKNVDFVIFDEGSINDCINLTWRFGLSFNILERQLKSISYLDKTNIMIFDTDIETSFSRINERKGLTFIDYENLKKRKKILEEVYPYFVFASNYMQKNYSNVTLLDLNESSENRIINIEKKLLNNN